MHSGEIVGFRQAPSWGNMANLLIRDNMNEIHIVPCNAESTLDALAKLFQGSYIGEWVDYLVDQDGVLTTIAPITVSRGEV